MMWFAIVSYCFLSVIVAEAFVDIVAKNTSLDEPAYNLTGISDNEHNPLVVRLHEVHDVDLEHSNEYDNRTKTLAEREVTEVRSGKLSTFKLKDLEDGLRLFQPPDISHLKQALNSLQNSTCLEHMTIALEALIRRERWAIQLLDSSAKAPEGMLAGSLYYLGNFDECISVKTHENQNLPIIKGKYCLADVTPNELLIIAKSASPFPRNEHSSTIHWAICIPDSCPEQDAEIILNFILNKAIGYPEAVSVKVTNNMCHVEQHKPFTALEITYGCIIIIFCSLIFLATLCHVIMHYKMKGNKIPSTTFFQVILAFSIVKNVSKLLKVGPKSELNLNCICGIKFFSMIFIIAGHTLVFMVGGPVTNESFFKEAIQKIENSIFLNNPLLVDTFLLTSGFLMCRLILLELDKRKGKVNFLALYIFRYIRLTPAYLVVIGFYCTWFIRINNGPLWDSKISLERERCLASWWTNILYINNYVNIDKLCMFQSWYLSVDTQLFMMSPFIVYPLWKWRSIGQSLLILGTVVSIFIPFVITYLNKLDPTFMTFAPEIQDISSNWYFINVYMKTHMRASPYCFGLILGYILHRIQSSDYKFSKSVLIPGWILGIACMLSSLFSIIIFYDPDYEYSPLKAAVYAALHRSIWCIGIGWIILACITNNAGPVEQLLSWKPLIPFSRLTYCAYLVNGLVELHDASTIRHAHYMSVYHLASNVLSHIVLTFAVGFVLSIFFESPIHGFEKIFLKRGNKNTDQNQTTA